MPENTPVLDTLAAMTAASMENCELEARDMMLARIAALASVDAPPVSYLINAGAASDSGITLEDVQGILVAIAPIIGAPMVVDAAANIGRALGFAVEVAEEELETTGDGG
jgi:alkylhydroperoxidase/carboxymuconolactone decarboxylase family protein YurZ